MTSEDVPTSWEEIEERSNMDVMKEETRVTFYAGDRLEENEEGEAEFVAEFKCFIVTPELKMRMLEQISMAMAQNYEEPFVILVPISAVDVRPVNFTYPMTFKGHKVYLVPYIRDIMVYENE